MEELCTSISALEVYLPKRLCNTTENSMALCNIAWKHAFYKTKTKYMLQNLKLIENILVLQQNAL